MIHLVLFLEELSAKVMLNGLLPRILPSEVSHTCIVFEGKQDLEKQIERKLRVWQRPDSAFIILRDQDSANCLTLKRNLSEKAHQAGKPQTIVRIACKELESWYFGDLSAVELALDINHLSRHSRNSKYRIPDDIINASTELEKITRGAYQKVSGSRAIGKHLTQKANTSRSFQVFLQGIEKALATV